MWGSKEVTLRAGLQELGKEARQTFNRRQTGVYRDWDDDSKLWLASDREVIRDVFPEDYTNGNVYHLSESKLSILLPGKVEADEDFRGRKVQLSLHGGKVDVKPPEKTGGTQKGAMLHCHGADDAARTSGKVKVDVDWKEAGSREPGQEWQDTTAGGAIRGTAGFSYSRPFLRLFIPHRGYVKAQHVTEVLLGVRFEAALYPAPVASKLDKDLQGESVKVMVGSARKKTPQEYVMTYSSEGPELKKKDIEGLDMMQVLGYVSNQWGPQAMLQPQSWKVIHVRVMGEFTTEGDADHIPPIIADDEESRSVASTIDSYRGSLSSKTSSRFTALRRKTCDLQRRLEHGITLPELKLGKRHGIPNNVFLLLEQLRALEDCGGDNFNAKEVMWALKTCGEAVKDPKLEQVFGAVACALQQRDPSCCNEYAILMARFHAQALRAILKENPVVSSIIANQVGLQCRQELQSYVTECSSIVALAVVAADVKEKWATGCFPEDQAFLKEAAEKLAPFPPFAPAVMQGLWDRKASRYLILDYAVRHRLGWDASSYFLERCPMEILCSKFQATWLETVKELSYFHLYRSFVAFRDCESAEDLVDCLAKAFAHPEADLISCLAVFLEDPEVEDRCKRDFLVSFISACRRMEQRYIGASQESPKRFKPAAKAIRKNKSAASLALLDPGSSAANTREVGMHVFELVLCEFMNKGAKERKTEKDLHELASMMEVALLLCTDDCAWDWARKKAAEEPEVADTAKRFLDKAGCQHAASQFKAVRRSTAFKYDDAACKELVQFRRPWCYDGRRSGYFSLLQQNADRRGEDVCHLLSMCFKLCLGLEGDCVYNLMCAMDDETSPTADSVGHLAPVGSTLRKALCKDVLRTFGAESLSVGNVERLLGYKGFFHPSLRKFLQNNAEKAAVCANKYFPLLEAVVKILSLGIGAVEGAGQPKASPDPERIISEVFDICQSSRLAWDLFGKVVSAICLPEFKYQGSGFTLDTICDLANVLDKVARLVEYKLNKGGSQELLSNVGMVVNSYLQNTEPRGWLDSFRSLDTVVFVLEFMGKEDLSLAYEQFKKEPVQAHADDGDEAKDRTFEQKGLLDLVQCAEKIYTKPLTSLSPSQISSDMQMREVMKKEAPKLDCSINWRGVPFETSDWDLVVEIAGAAADVMTKRYNVMMVPHHTQIITLLMFAIRTCGAGRKPLKGLPLPKTMLARVGTGEGKSLVIGMVAAFIAKKGMRAHVVNSNKTLSRRDFRLNEQLFELLGIRSGLDKKALTSKEHKVVYCTGEDIQNACLDCLMQGQVEEYQRRLRDTILVVDEVDGLMIDGGSNHTSFFEDRDISEKVNNMVSQLRQTGRIAENWDDFSEGRDTELQDEVEEAWDVAAEKQEGKDYAVQGSGVYMLDPKTGKIDEKAWSLWLEILKTTKSSSQWVKYQYPKAILSRLQCFLSYSCIFGLSGSLGQRAEREFLAKQCRALTFNVPPFLDTCRAEDGKAQGKAVPKHICETSPLPGERAQDRAVVELAAAKAADVPVLIITKDHESVERLASQVEKRLAALYGIGGKSSSEEEEDRVVRLLHNPRKPDEFCELVAQSTEPLKASESQQGAQAVPKQAWRITITTAEGGRGHDYRVVDPKIDEKGGLLLILTWVPWSEREWVQFLGRTGRQDHAGQYAIFLDAQDELVQDAVQYQRSNESLTDAILRVGDEDASDTFERTEVEITKGRIMHRLTSRFWIQEQKGFLSKDQKWAWKRLCEQYLDLESDIIQDEFDKVIPPEKEKIDDQDVDEGAKASQERRASLEGSPLKKTSSYFTRSPRGAHAGRSPRSPRGQPPSRPKPRVPWAYP